MRQPPGARLSRRPIPWTGPRPAPAYRADSPTAAPPADGPNVRGGPAAAARGGVAHAGGRKASRRSSVAGEHRAEIEVVAKGARPDMIEPPGAEEHRRCRQRDDRHPPAIADRLGAEGLARNRV